MLAPRSPVALLRDLPAPVAPPAAPPLVPAQRRPERLPTAPAPAPAPARRRRGPLVALLLPVALVAAALIGASSGAGADDGRVDAYFFGDSLMAGTGSTPLRPVMARVAASRLQWSVDVDAWGGTGYTTTGRSPSYLQRLRSDRALSRRYDVVLLEGGTNDARVGSSPTEIHAAVREVVAEVQRRQPQAHIVLMGAYDPPGVVRLHRAVADDAVRDVAAELGLPFFSPLSEGWHTGQDAERFLHRDGLHPNAYGYSVMGDRLAVALEQALEGTELVRR
ncbi:MAG: SGNH/GDSL hydrolase family protein [Actinomycetes bacterium]